MKLALYLIAMLSFISCSENQSSKIDTTINSKEADLSLVEKIENAHSKAEFLSKEVVRFDIVLSFGGTERLNGTMTLATNSSAGKIAYKNGQVLYFNRDKVFADSTTENTASARFAAYTWSYFFLFPYKLSDPGTRWSQETQLTLNEKTYNSQKLTFAEGVGDAPDDWYITYSDPETNLMEVAAYIVTAGGTSVEEAEEDPHAISYHDYKDVNGIALAHSWKFWEWRKDSGLTRQLGEATLSGFNFLGESEFNFSAPEDFVEIK